MAVAVRIIPCLDIDNGRVVKGVNFVGLRDAGDPVELAQRYEREGADEVTLLDITATSDNRNTTVELVERCAANLSIPLTVGGGVRTVEDAKTLLRAGADKVGVNSAAVKHPELITQIAEQFGSQCAVLAVDVKRRDPNNAEAGWDVYVAGGRTNTGLDAIEWVTKGAKLGAGEILLTSMDRDGVTGGYDLELLQAVTNAVDIPVIASGGAGEAQHLIEGVTIGKCDAVLAATIFHFGKYTIGEVKEAMREAGILVRL